MGEDLLQTRRVQRQVDFRCSDKIDRLTNTDIAQCCSHFEQRFRWRVLPLFFLLSLQNWVQGVLERKLRYWNMMMRFNRTWFTSHFFPDWSSLCSGRTKGLQLTWCNDTRTWHPTVSLSHVECSARVQVHFKWSINQWGHVLGCWHYLTCFRRSIIYNNCIVLQLIRKHPPTTVDFLTQESKTRSDSSQFLSLSTGG